MDAMQQFLPFFLEQTQQWLQLTLERPDYAAAIAVLVWTLMAILYSIRIAFLKKDITQLGKINSQTQDALNTAQEHGKALQQQMAEINGQLQQASELAKSESRRANNAEQQLSASKQQLADSLTALAEAFELNVASLPSSSAENLLTEYQAVIGRVNERFQNEQQAKTQLQLSLHAETAKLAEKEMLLSSLQHRLDAQTQQLAQMELSIEQYENAQRQLQADKEQQLAQMMAKHQAEAQKVADLEKQLTGKPVEVKTKPVVEPESRPAAPTIQQVIANKPSDAAVVFTPATPEVEAVQAEVSGQAAKTEQAEPVKKSEPVATPEPKAAKGAATAKAKGFWNKAMTAVSKLDQKLGATAENEQPSSPAVAEAEHKETSAQAAEQNVADHLPAVALNEQAELVVEAPSASVEEVEDAEQPSVVDPSSEEIQPGEAVSEKADNKVADKVTQKIGGLLGRFKSKK